MPHENVVKMKKNGVTAKMEQKGVKLCSYADSKRFIYAE